MAARIRAGVPSCSTKFIYLIGVANKKSKWPKGWFAIPGVQLGDRTLGEQLKGLEPALAYANGRTVLDLGCAEGLIAQAFANAGATLVHGQDYNAAFIKFARENVAAPCVFFDGELETPAPDWVLPQYDMVLMLAILHKLHNAKSILREYAQRTNYVVIRLPINSTGNIRPKHPETRGFKITNVNHEMEALGFSLIELIRGPRGEWVQHWKRAGG
jgi:SAM-dependent methyltransferase